jgi:cellulose synthase/poly-beta-1,6-N-acetylglucosamine synthase-like glycosyltransferase
MQTLWKIIIPDFLDFIYNCIYKKPAEDSFEKLLYDKNIYLAEDRILCMGLHQNGYSLAYLPDA